MYERDSAPAVSSTSRSRGISVVIPTFRAEGHIASCLGSLAAQTLSPDLFEIIIVLNGPRDGTGAVIDEFARRNPHLRVRRLTVNKAGVSRARNLGIAAARQEFTTFVDDDDTVSPTFLSSLLAYAGEHVIPIANIADVADGGEPDHDNKVNEQLRAWAGQRARPEKLPRAMGFNAAKLIPTRVAQEVAYDGTLSSGEDIVFFMSLLAHHPFVFQVVAPDDQAIYYRTVRPNSVSRREMTFSFAVEDRVRVIARLDALMERCPPDRQGVAAALMRAQAGVIRRFLDARPDHRGDALRNIREQGLANFPYDVLNRGLARTLAVSYCFVPYVDTSAIVAAKRIRAAGDIVDVIYNAMDSVRGTDKETTRISAELIDQALPIHSPSSFGNWAAIRDFCMRGMSAIQSRRPPEGYERLYSRVVWPASHFLAALYKVRHPEVVWTAEFSDPVSRDVHGLERTSPLTDDELLRELLAAARKAGADLPMPDNMYAAAENIAYALADELVFTNENQRDYMLSYCPPALAETARLKARVDPHPSLPAEFYTASPATLDDLPADTVNLAYFGTFYATRGLTEVVDAIARLEDDTRKQVRLHVFTGNAEEISEQVRTAQLDDVIVVRPYRPYLQFLNLTTAFDCLLVNDAKTGSSHSVNPYLPSKWSDYMGSGTPVWGLVEPGSPLSREPLTYATPTGDVDAAAELLLRLVAAKVPPAG
ncbi:Glycosyltransferase involved in cell wall bisynthesis [Jiangella alkaliphila]|uniref:Glycosyltransferase involved in cell wall bisynthesis n=1 Tax=Jiangella alkaliphila TaxID=419479 RepID=A0A1H2LZ64_9ACTN|nr:Glycosyltransferase involved in cell wall bisynthesis [Jiangella alkaliphila]